MMGLFSTIRGKKDFPIIGNADVGPIPTKSKRMVIQEWPRLLKQQPDLFKIVWIQSAARSNSIKSAFGMKANEDPEKNEAFVALGKTIAAFFFKLIITCQLDDDQVVTTCEQLGRRHVDFIARGFHSTFWDIFLVCMAETIDITLSEYYPDESRRDEMILAWQRVINTIVHHMRAGYTDRRKEEFSRTS